MADTTRRIVDIADNQEIDMALKDLGSSQYADKVHVASSDVSFGGGTQYTEGDTDASITGTAVMWEDTGDTLRAASAAKPLPVEIITGGGGGTQYDEDTASTAGEKITMAGVVRKDAAASMVGTDGDRTELQVDATGNLRTSDETAQGSLATISADVATGNGFLTTIDGSLTQLQGAVVAEDSAMPDGVTGLAILGTRNDAAGTTLTDTNGDASSIAVDSKGRVLTDGSTFTQPVSGTVTANAGTNLNTSALALETGGNLAAATTALQIMDDWDESDRAKVNPIAGQAGVQGGAGASTALTQRVALATDANATTPVGNVAHDAVDSGNPVKVGTRAVAAVSTATMVAAADRTDAISDIDGAIITRDSRPLGDVISERVSNTNGTSTAFTNFSAVASTRNIVTGYSVYNDSDTAAYLDLRDGTAGTVLWTIPLPPRGGANLYAPNGIFRTTANTALAYDVSAAITTVYISVTGFRSKV